jgi:hypothetical protein
MSIRTIAPALLALAVGLAGVLPSRAGTLDIVVESTTALPGTAGGFDVDLVNNSASTVTVASFSVDVLLTDTTFVTFTGINNSTVAPYIFSLSGSFPPGFSGNLLPMEATGNDLAATAGQIVNPGETWGLAHISYLVDPAAPPGTVVPMVLEQFPVNLPPPGGTNLLDPTGAQIAFSGLGSNGTITVGTRPVPEPSSVVLAGIAALAGWGAWARQRASRRRNARKITAWNTTDAKRRGWGAAQAGALCRDQCPVVEGRRAAAPRRASTVRQRRPCWRGRLVLECGDSSPICRRLTLAHWRVVANRS